MDRDGRGLCRCERTAGEDPFDVTRAGAHGAEGRTVNFLKFGRRFFTQQILDSAVYVGNRKYRSGGATDWKSGDTETESTGPRSPCEVVQLFLQHGIGGVWIDSHFER